MAWVVAVFSLLLGLSFVPWAADVVVSRHGRARVTLRLHWGRLRSRRSSSYPVGTSRSTLLRDPSPSASESGETSGTGARSGRNVGRVAGRLPTRGKPRLAGKKSGPSLRQVHAVLRTPGLSQVLRRTVQQLVRSLRPRELELTVTLGLGDPFETGRLLGLLGPALAVLVALGPRRLQVAPDFDRRRLDVEGVATVVVVPGMLVLILLGALFSRPTLRAFQRFATV